MVRLFIDTSSDYLSLVLASDGNILASLRLLAGRSMSEELLGQINNIMNSSGCKISDVEEFYAITGPGSFTGVRIGVAMAMGLAEGSSKPCYGITSLDAVAICSGQPVCKAASRLKGNIFAVREYDFSTSIFSEYKCDELEASYLDSYFIVNSGVGTFVDLEKTALDCRVVSFRGECAPLYLRKSEAELNLDKTGCNK